MMDDITRWAVAIALFVGAVLATVGWVLFILLVQGIAC